MTYSTTTTSSGTATINFPASCLTQQGATITCAELGALLMQSGTGATGSCTGTSSCSCTITLQNQTGMEMGTYTTTPAGLLTLTPTGGTVTQDDYCVKGSTLTISPHSAADGSGTLTFTKQ
jgi:hypothetical protein